MKGTKKKNTEQEEKRPPSLFKLRFRMDSSTQRDIPIARSTNLARHSFGCRKTGLQKALSFMFVCTCFFLFFFLQLLLM